MRDFLKDLNKAQREAVKCIDGPILILAGPGSGKTRVLTYKIAYLLSLGVRPWEILALTFTNKAANEMKERAVQLVGDIAKNVVMGTFHSVFAKILRQEAERLGYTRSFTIYDQDDSLSLIKSIIKELNFPEDTINPSLAQAKISNIKNAFVSPEVFSALAENSFDVKIAQIYKAYQSALFQRNAMDFDDLLIKSVELFERYPDVLEKYQTKFKYILVDEYQDTNRVQYILLRMLSAKHRNLCVIGDDAQSIYSWRGAEIRNMLDFKNDFPDCKIFKLEQNYRSTKKILRAADSVIKNNTEQIFKNLWTENSEGEPIVVLECRNDRDEAEKVVHFIKEEIRRNKYNLRDFVILYRTNAQSRLFEDELRRQGFPYTIVGSVAFYKRKEIKDLLAYFRLIVNPRDDESLLRIVNFPNRGIGDVTIERVKAFANVKGLSLFEAMCRSHTIPGLTEKARKNIFNFCTLIQKYIDLKDKISAGELARALVDDLGLIRFYKQEGTPEAQQRIENIEELLSAITEFSNENPEDGGLEKFLEQVSLIAEIDTWENKRDAITLMTLHSAKGLEFPVVFITGLEEGLFPIASSIYNLKELEEERRLFYVGMTRAMRKLYLSYAKERMRAGNVFVQKRSRFLDEIPPELVSYYSSREDKKERVREVKISSPMFQPKNIGVGSLVKHEVFGLGVVVDISGSGDGIRVMVDFKEYGRKLLLLKYANLKVI
ncbi:DNA helicase-2 / ATP-dependent DNA helicase PcrA [Candidatus Kryptonium thompsonii]|uniref:DNA 3'-5' helicase n=2 Tax=Candidatus Kryptonium thompsonii TaxID=1633631 RepID=A0A0P1MNZ6_9BACT|nr:DNA helicase-2 / ATP-dependent DNA helicase PcrA [Candidatus Kryptonium thompsoni]CUS81620.1 DNA helicase-2 / ATP-dependent DNA helicase PcrA [Candidatus Kryptonium thompsoni]CUS83689.1 DNA helicase-2 / ATP-dependent DNA helicase PcrA [Candidatus Kryptonium thompsoni]CUS87127.1 DNA helicase-2 / ATP-dependent DNA helicase PcrA [Candidatus Kryptonium thompsoni]CUS95454.1 DNA helicase-2 / ATP-dependent DNA helicase PcrA [Candidatus Kryptonium thompsoni]